MEKEENDKKEKVLADFFEKRKKGSQEKDENLFSLREEDHLSSINACSMVKKALKGIRIAFFVAGGSFAGLIGLNVHRVNAIANTKALMNLDYAMDKEQDAENIFEKNALPVLTKKFKQKALQAQTFDQKIEILDEAEKSGKIGAYGSILGLGMAAVGAYFAKKQEDLAEKIMAKKGLAFAVDDLCSCKEYEETRNLICVDIGERQWIEIFDLPENCGEVCREENKSNVFDDEADYVCVPFPSENACGLGDNELVALAQKEGFDAGYNKSYEKGFELGTKKALYDIQSELEESHQTLDEFLEKNSPQRIRIFRDDVSSNGDRKIDQTKLTEEKIEKYQDTFYEQYTAGYTQGFEDGIKNGYVDYVSKASVQEEIEK